MINFQKLFHERLSMSDGLDPDQDQRFVDPDLGPKHQTGPEKFSYEFTKPCSRSLKCQLCNA